METHGPLGVIWVSLGLGCFYIALIWINSLLGLVITPLFVLLTNSILGMVFGKKAQTPPT
ncbi:MAG TPA: hypothetical protein VGO46_07530 [Gemmatimonadaceae bacterium]|nr:hypothetical protein [Gemmatimonadaceae bacterium]